MSLSTKVAKVKRKKLVVDEVVERKEEFEEKQRRLEGSGRATLKLKLSGHRIKNLVMDFRRPSK